MNLRAYLYLDFERVLSLYAQQNDAMISSVVQRRVEEIISGDTRGGANEETRERRETTETLVLHDQVFGTLERGLEGAIVDLTGIGSDAYEGLVQRGALVSVTGPGVFQDFDYARQMFGRFNELGAVLGYMSRGDELREYIMSGGSAKDKKSKTARGEEFLAEIGLRLDPELLRGLTLIMESFKGEAYEFVFGQDSTQEEARVRALLDRRWLRRTPQAIRWLYGDEARTHWTLVGTVTDLRVPNDTSKEGDRDGAADIVEPGGLGAAFDKVFSASRNIERVFGTPELPELIVDPIAIYRQLGSPD